MPLSLDRSMDFLRDPKSGRLTNANRMHSLYVPKSVVVERGALRFSWPDNPVHVEVPSDLLERFLQIDRFEKTLAFARRFGPLLLDPTDILSHTLTLLDEGRETMLARIDPTRESTACWARTIVLFQALIRLAVSLREAERPDALALYQMSSIPLIQLESSIRNEADRKMWETLDPDDQRFSATVDLEYNLMALVDACGLRPIVHVANWKDLLAGRNKVRPRFDLLFQDVIGRVLHRHDKSREGLFTGSLSLFGALLTQLMATCAGTGFATCASCGSMYVPKRKPRSGERHYCQRCGRAAAVKAAKARYIKKRNDKKGLPRRQDGSKTRAR